jgi:hypothetical protein
MLSTKIVSIVPTRPVFRVGTTTSAKLAGRAALKRWYNYRIMRRVYAQAGSGQPSVADAQAVAADRKHGKLTRAKDYPTLRRAFARVQKLRPCWLMILGKGSQQHDLEALATDLGIADDFALPGFTTNPYAFLDLLVLSLAWEGSPPALTEALTLGIPAVSTDCPSGPREILQNGRLGPLVPVGDHEALAHAMLNALDHPPEATVLRAAARLDTVEESSKRYLMALGFTNATQE